MYDIFNILAGIFFLATFASIIYIVVKAIKKQFTKSLLLLPVVLFVIYLVVCAVAPEEPKDNSETKQNESVVESSTETAAEIEIETESTTANSTEESSEEETETTEAETIGIRNENLNGRGNSDSGRSEPQYENVIGYIAVSSIDYDVKENGTFTETPWTVLAYQKDKQFYEENGTIDHKTEVVVKAQELKHEGWGNYSGYLLVEILDNNEQFYIDVTDFVTKPYWTYDLESAASTGYCIAEYNQVSDYYPVDNRNEKVELDKGMKVLVTGRTGTYGGDLDRNIHSIEAYVYKEWIKGYGSVPVFFNPDDLTIVY